MGTAEVTYLQARSRMGTKDYNLGNHPLWEVSRVLYQMTKRPRILGGLALGWGYLAAAVRRAPRPVSAELVRFVRQEQMDRLRQKVTGRTPGFRAASES